MVLLIEVCVDSLDAVKIVSTIATARLSAKGEEITNNIDRLEICGMNSLHVGGLTVEVEFLEQIILHCCNMKVMLMIRPKYDSFVYNNEEIEHMKQSILKLHRFKNKIHIMGFVFGCLQESSSKNIAQILECDIENMNKLCKYVYELDSNYEITFHRAIDEQNVNVKSILDYCIMNRYGNITRILTSGGGGSSVCNPNNIKHIVEYVKINQFSKNKRIKIVAGSGITKDNIIEIITNSFCDEIHGSFKGDKKILTKAYLENICNLVKSKL